jgi:ABC-type Fe3+/spermidine/putrescine transport system ATPase subunit
MALKKIRKTIFILVTHDGQEVLSLADHIAFFSDGKIQRIDTPEAFYFSPTDAYEGLFFGDLNVIKRNKNQMLFRPTEFSLNLENEGEEIEIKFVRKSFCGPYYQNFFKVGKKETIVLYHKESLEYVHKIKIDKRIS